MLTISQSKIPLILKRKFNNSIPTIVPQVQSGKGGKGRLYTDLDSLPDKVETLLLKDPRLKESKNTTFKRASNSRTIRK